MKTVEPGRTQIGWIGTGVMGNSMAGHLLKAGFEVTCFNRTQNKAKQLLDRGAKWAATPKLMAESCDVIFSIVGFPSDVEEIFFGDSGVFQSLSADKVIVDMTTSKPSLAVRIAESAKRIGAFALDAPVSGGDIGAKNAALSIMVGGDKNVFEALMPCWNAMGKTIVYHGPAGSGQHTKMVNQTLIAGGMIALCEALLYAYRAGLNIELVLQSVSQGAAGSWSLTNLGPRILRDDLMPGFFVDHFVKDMGIVLEEAKRMKLVMPGLSLAEQLYIGLQSQGDGQLGTHALMKTLGKLSNIDWLNRQ